MVPAVVPAVEVVVEVAVVEMREVAVEVKEEIVLHAGSIPSPWH